MFTIVESSVFARYLPEYLSDDEYAALQWFLAAHPEAGSIIRGAGGVRKLRWGLRGRGMRGGVRVIYCAKQRIGEIWLLTIYGKNVEESIPAHILRKMKEAFEDVGD
jgi:hypothetical protein